MFVTLLFAITSVIVGIAAAVVWWRSRPEKSEALDLLCDLVEVEAECLEHWSLSDPKRKRAAQVTFSSNTLYHKSGELSVERSAMGSCWVNTQPVTRRGALIVDALFKEWLAWDSEQNELRELAKVTEALRRKEPSPPVDNHVELLRARDRAIRAQQLAQGRNPDL